MSVYSPALRTCQDYIKLLAHIEPFPVLQDVSQGPKRRIFTGAETSFYIKNRKLWFIFLNRLQMPFCRDLTIGSFKWDNTHEGVPAWTGLRCCTPPAPETDLQSWNYCHSSQASKIHTECTLLSQRRGTRLCKNNETMHFSASSLASSNTLDD